MTLTKEANNILHALTAGSTLKAHRYLDGTKIFKLHDLGGGEKEVAPDVVAELLRQGFVTSNYKFPAATFMLTPEGKNAADRID